MYLAQYSSEGGLTCTPELEAGLLEYGGAGDTLVPPCMLNDGLGTGLIGWTLLSRKLPAGWEVY